MSKQFIAKGYTGADIARKILDAAGVSGVSIVPIAGEMTDNFNPTTNTVSLSQGVYNSTTIAAAGIAAHECGHAIQHHTNYLPLVLRSASVPLASIGSMIYWPVILLGLILGYMELAQIGVLLSVAEGRSILNEDVYDKRFRYLDELRRMGARIWVENRAAIVEGGSGLQGAPVTATDLRAGAAMMLAGLLAQGETVLSDPAGHIRRGYADLPAQLRDLGAQVEERA